MKTAIPKNFPKMFKQIFQKKNSTNILLKINSKKLISQKIKFHKIFKKNKNLNEDFQNELFKQIFKN